jgi:hypothetical protein
MCLLCKSSHHAPDTLLTALPAHNPCHQGLPSSPCPDGYRTATLQCNPIQLTVPPHSTHLGYVLPRDVSDLLANPLVSRTQLRVLLYMCGNKAGWTRLRLRPIPYAVPALYPLQRCVSLQTLPAGTGDSLTIHVQSRHLARLSQLFSDRRGLLDSTILTHRSPLLSPALVSHCCPLAPGLHCAQEVVSDYEASPPHPQLPRAPPIACRQ